METIEVIKPNGQTIETVVKKMTDEEGTAIESCPHLSKLLI